MAVSAAAPAPVIIEGAKSNGAAIGVYAFFVALAGGVAYYFYSQGKQTTTIKKDVYDTNPDGNPTNVPQNIPYLTQLAGQVYDDLNGINLFANHNEQLYDETMSLSNTDFVGFYNIWNDTYQQEYGKPLKAAIEEHGALPFTPWATVKDAVLARMDTLKLK
jgi:hypothetical protein